MSFPCAVGHDSVAMVVEARYKDDTMVYVCPVCRRRVRTWRKGDGTIDFIVLNGSEIVDDERKWQERVQMNRQRFDQALVSSFQTTIKNAVRNVTDSDRENVSRLGRVLLDVEKGRRETAFELEGIRHKDDLELESVRQKHSKELVYLAQQGLITRQHKDQRFRVFEMFLRDLSTKERRILSTVAVLLHKLMEQRQLIAAQITQRANSDPLLETLGKELAAMEHSLESIANEEAERVSNRKRDMILGRLQPPRVAATAVDLTSLTTVRDGLRSQIDKYRKRITLIQDAFEKRSEAIVEESLSPLRDMVHSMKSQINWTPFHDELVSFLLQYL
jgi:hypothetical protein